MNAISAILHRSEYATEPHLVIAIDGEPLNVLLSKIHPDRDLLGLVPTAMDWLTDPRERQIVWERILPPPGQSSFAPVLMCPDDADFWCTIVTAEVIAEPAVVCWSRLGVDTSEASQLPDGIGSSVDWLPGVGPYHFERAQYELCFQKLRMLWF